MAPIDDVWYVYVLGDLDGHWVICLETGVTKYTGHKASALSSSFLSKIRRWGSTALRSAGACKTHKMGPNAIKPVHIMLQTSKRQWRKNMKHVITL